jgi:putative ABC transport system permease protein
LVLCESLVVTLLGGLVGIGAALLILAWNNLVIGTEGVTISFAPSAGMMVLGLAVAVVVGVLAGLVPAWQASRADIVASLRSV